MRSRMFWTDLWRRIQGLAFERIWLFALVCAWSYLVWDAPWAILFLAHCYYNHYVVENNAPIWFISYQHFWQSERVKNCNPGTLIPQILQSRYAFFSVFAIIMQVFCVTVIFGIVSIYILSLYLSQNILLDETLWTGVTQLIYQTTRLFRTELHSYTSRALPAGIEPTTQRVAGCCLPTRPTIFILIQWIVIRYFLGQQQILPPNFHSINEVVLKINII